MAITHNCKGQDLSIAYVIGAGLECINLWGDLMALFVV